MKTSPAYILQYRRITKLYTYTYTYIIVDVVMENKLKRLKMLLKALGII